METDFICGGPSDDLLFGEGAMTASMAVMEMTDCRVICSEVIQGTMILGVATAMTIFLAMQDMTCSLVTMVMIAFGVVRTTTTSKGVLTPTAVMRDWAPICAIRSRSKIIVEIDTTISSIIKPK